MRFQFTTDDVCPANLKHFHWWDKAKEANPDLKVIAFTIANFNGQSTADSDVFIEWYEERKDWVEIGVHGWDHDLGKVQEGWREDQDQYIRWSELSLRKFRPMGGFLYRPPGFRVLPITEKILREQGFRGIAHQGFIKTFADGTITPTLDTHCTDQGWENEIKDCWDKLPKQYEKT